MSYLCKKCGRLISHEMMFTARISWQDLTGRPAPMGCPEMTPIWLPRCPYCGSERGQYEDDYWFLKHYELRLSWREAVRHQRNVEWEGEMEAEVEAVKGFTIPFDASKSEYFSAFAEIRKKVKAMREAGA